MLAGFELMITFLAIMAVLIICGHFLSLEMFKVKKMLILMLIFLYLVLAFFTLMR